MAGKGKNDLIVLRDGDTLTGEVQLSEFHIKTSYAELRFPKNQIIHIHFNNPPQFKKDEILLASADRIKGEIIPQKIPVTLKSNGDTVQIDQDVIHTIMFLDNV